MLLLLATASVNSIELKRTARLAYIMAIDSNASSDFDVERIAFTIKEME